MSNYKQNSSLIHKLPFEIYHKITSHLNYLEIVQLNEIRSCDEKLLAESKNKIQKLLDSLSLKRVIEYFEMNELNIPRQVLNGHIAGFLDIEPRISLLESAFYKIDITSTNEMRIKGFSLNIGACFDNQLLEDQLSHLPCNLKTVDPNNKSVRNTIDKIIIFKVLEVVSFGKPEEHDSLKFLQKLLDGDYGIKNKIKIESYLKTFLSNEASVKLVISWFKKCVGNFLNYFVDRFDRINETFYRKGNIKAVESIIEDIIRCKKFVWLISQFAQNDSTKQKLENISQWDFMIQFVGRKTIGQIVRILEFPEKSVKFLDRLIEEPFESCDWFQELQKED